MNSINLLQYLKKIYSQYGEEGVLEYFINQLELKYIECCEFGMSGTTFSNTLYLLKNYKSYGVFIDQSIQNLDKLNLPNTHLIVKKIEIEGSNSLDNILSDTILTKDFDVLSIDVDNIDYHIWKSLKNYCPKIVIIEFNPFLPPDLEYVHDGTKFSSSFLSTIKLGESKGYKLVCMTGNLIFVRKDILLLSSLAHLLDVDSKDLFLDDAVVDSKNNRSYTFKRYLQKHII